MRVSAKGAKDREIERERECARLFEREREIAYGFVANGTAKSRVLSNILESEAKFTVTSMIDEILQKEWLQPNLSCCGIWKFVARRVLWAQNCFRITQS